MAINNRINEVDLGNEIAKGKNVGDKVFCFAGAPGVGHIIYQITRFDEQGNAYAVVIEDTIWVPEPEYFR